MKRVRLKTNSIQYVIKNQHRVYNFKNSNSIDIHDTGVL